MHRLLSMRRLSSHWSWLRNHNQQFGIFAKLVGNTFHTFKNVPLVGRHTQPFHHRLE
jgi:hypothetical protein